MADLSQFGVDCPEPEEPTAEADPDTSEEYKFSRPQCRAAPDGERCLNPVRRTDDNAEFCPCHHEMDVRTIDDEREPGVKCDVAGCEGRVVGMDDGWEYDRGVVCQDCIDYNQRHGHWPDEDRDPCVECLIDGGVVRHDCPESSADAVLVEPGSACGNCGEEVADAD